jgi:RNA polymerase sigma-70 factor (ECF subfamily)
MPPIPLEYQGRDLVGQFFATVAFRNGRRYRLVATRANGQPAFGVYLRESLTPAWRAFGVFVITLSGHEVTAITRFDNGSLDRLGLPRTLDD